MGLGAPIRPINLTPSAAHPESGADTLVPLVSQSHWTPLRLGPARQPVLAHLVPVLLACGPRWTDASTFQLTAWSRVSELAATISAAVQPTEFGSRSRGRLVWLNRSPSPIVHSVTASYPKPSAPQTIGPVKAPPLGKSCQCRCQPRSTEAGSSPSNGEGALNSPSV